MFDSQKIENSNFTLKHTYKNMKNNSFTDKCIINKLEYTVFNQRVILSTI